MHGQGEAGQVQHYLPLAQKLRISVNYAYSSAYDVEEKRISNHGLNHHTKDLTFSKTALHHC